MVITIRLNKLFLSEGSNKCEIQLLFAAIMAKLNASPRRLRVYADRARETQRQQYDTKLALDDQLKNVTYINKNSALIITIQTLGTFSKLARIEVHLVGTYV